MAICEWMLWICCTANPQQIEALEFGLYTVLCVVVANVHGVNEVVSYNV